MEHKIIFAEHIVCVFPENIISRFDVAVNDVAKEFAEKFRLKYATLVLCFKNIPGRYTYTILLI